MTINPSHPTMQTAADAAVMSALVYARQITIWNYASYSYKNSANGGIERVSEFVTIAKAETNFSEAILNDFQNRYSLIETRTEAGMHVNVWYRNSDRKVFIVCDGANTEARYWQSGLRDFRDLSRGLLYEHEYAQRLALEDIVTSYAEAYGPVIVAGQSLGGNNAAGVAMQL